MVTARERWSVTVVTLAIVLASVVLGGRPESDPHVRGLGAGVQAAGAELRTFDDCAPLLEHLRGEALERVGPYGLPIDTHGAPVQVDAMVERPGVWESVGRAVGRAFGQATDEAAAPSDGGGDGGESGTNVQVAGVDEADLVKTDGQRLVAIAQGAVVVVDVTGDQPRLLGRWAVQGAGSPVDLLLHGDRLLVLSHGAEAVRPTPEDVPAEPDTAEPAAGDAAAPDASSRPVAPPGPDEPVTDIPQPSPTHGSVLELTTLDIADPTRIAVVSRLQVDGDLIAARLVDDVARIVVRSQPVALRFVHPGVGGLRGEQEALEANREVVRRSTAAQWLPWYVHHDAQGTRTEGPLLDCSAVHAPPIFSGFGAVSVLTVGLADAAMPRDATAVLAGAQHAHADGERLHVATTRWIDPQRLPAEDLRRSLEQWTTEIHAFDTTDRRHTRYVGSGQVDGHLLDQWAMDRHDGHLRVASTRGAPFDATSESAVTVLAERAGALVEVGEVAGMGIGERIYAVRFIGDVGYVVTFRQVDPLYTLDLRDPADPRVVGELKILGYSAYLHPVGDGLVLGVGQDADERGTTTGTQLSLFDVADPAAPVRLHQVTLPGGTSEVEHDHRAFLHWAETGLTVVPVQQWRWDEAAGTEGSFVGAYGYVADREGGIRELGRLAHERAAPSGHTDPSGTEMPEPVGGQAPIRRSLVVGDRLLTVSERGVMTSGLDDLRERGWLGF